MFIFRFSGSGSGLSSTLDNNKSTIAKLVNPSNINTGNSRSNNSNNNKNLQQPNTSSTSFPRRTRCAIVRPIQVKREVVAEEDESNNSGLDLSITSSLESR